MFNIIKKEKSKKTIELKGLRSVAVWGVAQSLIIPLRMLPEYAGYKTHSIFLYNFGKQPKDIKRELIKVALSINPSITAEDYTVILSLVKDENGIPLSNSRLQTMSIDEIINTAVEVLVECLETEVFFTTLSEIKQLPPFIVDLNFEVMELAKQNNDFTLEQALEIAVSNTVKKYKEFKALEKQVN